jgi:hypothetical protein
MGQLHFQTQLAEASRRLESELVITHALLRRGPYGPLLGDPIVAHRVAREIIGLNVWYAERLTMLYAEGRIQLYDHDDKLGLVRCKVYRGDEFAEILPDYPGGYR